MTTATEKISHFNNALSSLTPEYINVFWAARRDDVIMHAIYRGVLDAGSSQSKNFQKASQGKGTKHAKKQYSPMPASVVPKDMLVLFRKRFLSMGQEFREKECLQPYLEGQILKFFRGDIPKPLDKLIAMVVVGHFYAVPEASYPTAEEIQEASADTSACTALMERFDPIISVLRALGQNDLRRIAAKKFLRTINTIHRESELIKSESQEGEESADMAAIMDYEINVIHPWLKARHAFANAIRSLRRTLQSLPEDIFGKFAQSTFDSLARLSEADYINLEEDLRDYLDSLLPPPFDAAMLLAQLAAVEPPLEEEDLATAQAEIAALDSGEKRADRSWVLAWLMPALNGEGGCTSAELRTITKTIGEPFPFTPYLLVDLAASLKKINYDKIGNPKNNVENEETSESKLEQQETQQTGQKEQPTQENSPEDQDEKTNAPAPAQISDASDAESPKNPDEGQDVEDSETPVHSEIDMASAEQADAQPTEPETNGDNNSEADALVNDLSTAKAQVPPQAAGETNSEMTKTAAEDMAPETSDSASLENNAEQQDSETNIDYQQFASPKLPDALRPRIVSGPGLHAQAKGRDMSLAFQRQAPRPSFNSQPVNDIRSYNQGFTAEEITALGAMGGLEKLFSQNGRSSRKTGGQEDDTASSSAADDSDGHGDGCEEKTFLDNIDLERMQTLLQQAVQDNYTPGIPNENVQKAAYEALLAEKDTAGLYWLAQSRATDLPLWLAELVHRGAELNCARDTTALEVLLAEAASNHLTLSDGYSLLLLAALIRPALLMPRPQYMAGIFANMENRLGHFGLGPLLQNLRSFISRGMPIDEAIFSGKTEAQLREFQQRTLREETQEFMVRMEKSRSKYAPASYVTKNLFSPQGELRIILEACLTGNSTDLHLQAERLIDADYQDKLIENNMRPGSTKEIIAGAGKKLHGDLQACAILVKKWADFYQQTERGHDNYFVATVLAGIKLPEQHDALCSLPEGKFLQGIVESIGSPTPKDECPPAKELLELWPYTMACARHREQDIFFDPADLSAAIQSGAAFDTTQKAAALAAHAVYGFSAKPTAYVQYFPELQGVFVHLREQASDAFELLGLGSSAPLGQILSRSRTLWDTFFNMQLKEVEELVSDCYFRGAITYDRQSLAQSTLSNILAKYQDRGEKIAGLLELDAFRHELEEHNDAMLAEVENRLERLGEDCREYAQNEFVKAALKQTRQNRNFIVAWDNVARLEDHLAGNAPVPVLQNPGKLAGTAAADFYDHLIAGNIAERHADSRVWREALEIRDPTPIFFRVLTELLGELGFDLKQTERAENLIPSGAPFYWRRMEYTMQIKSPLPLWGSEAHSRHKIALAWGNLSPQDIHNHMTSKYYLSGDAVTLICFTSFSHQDRLRLLELAPDWDVFPLIIDANLYNYIKSHPDADNVKMLFEIALAGSPYNPYTPEAAGFVPREMFYGRMQEKKQIEQNTGSCLIYGGRQLGKSALLQQLRLDLEQKEGIVVIDITLGNTATSLLDDLLRQCVKLKIAHPNTTVKTLPDHIETWLEEDPRRRIYAFLDESDSALDHDIKRGFKEAEILRDLMQKTGRKFKPVLAGLHSVQRFSHFPNSPLYHFGEPICIGPLDRGAAFQLITAPLAILGINFQNPQLAQMALSHCNYHPRLIQMFGSELLAAIRRKHPGQPCQEIDEATVREVYKSQNLNRKIRDCFSMTIDLDKRYFVIAYTMALGAKEGLNLQTIWDEVRAYWPAAFKQSDLQTIKSLMEEMQGLGLVIALGGRYRLRTPNIVELLGGEDAVIQALAQYANMDYTPPNDPDQLRIKGAYNFVASQYNQLADKVTRLCYIPGSTALGLATVPDALLHIGQDQENDTNLKVVRIDGMNVNDAMKSLSQNYGNMRSGGLIAWISSDQFPAMEEFMDRASLWLERLRGESKYVKIVCLIWPRDLYAMLESGAILRHETAEMPLLPWTLTGVEARCREDNRPIETARTIYQETGGWPLLVDAIFSGENTSPLRLVKLTEKLARDVPSIAPILAQLPLLQEAENLNDEDLLSLLTDNEQDPATVALGIAFLKKLSILREKNGHLQVAKHIFTAGEVG